MLRLYKGCRQGTIDFWRCLLRNEQRAGCLPSSERRLPPYCTQLAVVADDGQNRDAPEPIFCVTETGRGAVEVLTISVFVGTSELFSLSYHV